MEQYMLVNGKIIGVNIHSQEDMIRWLGWYENFKNRRVDVTDMGGGVSISTVFLCFPHGKDEQGRNYLFESMVLGGKYSQRGWRYCTYGEAKRGHWHIVDCIKAGEPPFVAFGERPSMEFFFDLLEEEKKGEEWKNGTEDKD